MDIKTLITKHEGLRLWAYLDSLMIWTIGVGFNLERAGAAEALAKAGVNYDMIWAAIEECKKAGGGRKPGQHTPVALITAEQADALLGADIAEASVGATKLCPDMATWPPTAQAVLIDLVFNMGVSRLSSWKHTLASFNAKDWKGVAKNLSISEPWYTQVGGAKGRSGENVALMQSI